MRSIRVINPTIQTEEKPRLRVAAYCRVSSGSEEQLDSYAAQVRHYTDKITENSDWELCDIYADEAITGTRIDTREDFQRMLLDCRRGKIDRILCKSISRFSRNTQEGLATIRELSALGVEVIFEKENINTGEMQGEFMLGTYCSFAQRESEIISGNLRWSYQQRMQSGQFITCSRPLGYQLQQGKLLPDEQEAQVVAHIFSSYLSGMGTAEIATELTQAGITKKDGGTIWHRSSVAYILQNEKYIGDAMLQKTYATDTLPFQQKRNHGEKDQYYLHGSHTPLLDREAYQQTLDIFQKRGQRIVSPKIPHPSPFRKRIRCGSCGSVFKRKVRVRGVYWICYSHDANSTGCPVKQIPETELQAAFVRMAAKLQKHSRHILHPLVNGLLELRSRQYQSNEKIGEINLEIAQLNEQNLVLTRLRSKGYLDSVLFMEQTNELNRKIATLRTDRRRLMGQDEEEQTIQLIKQLIERIENAELNSSFDEELFSDIVENITVDSRISIRFHLIGGLELPETIREVSR